MTDVNISFIRKPELKAQIGLEHAALHQRINRGTLPKPIKLGPRASAWIKHEIDLVAAAMAAGASNDELTKLVSELHAARESRYQSLRRETFARIGQPS